MGLDQNRFFRDSILAITSSLDIEEALHTCYLHFKKHLPIDHLMLMHPEFEQNRMKVLAQANDRGGSLDQRHWDIPPKTVARLAGNQVPPIMIVNRPESHFLARHALWLGARGASILIVRLLVGPKLVGSLILRKNGHDQYTKEHARLLAPLREPFAVALSNSLRFQELRELKNRLAEESRFFQEELSRNSGQEIIGAEYGLRRVMDMVRQVAPRSSPVLLLGATGVGKEVIAGAIHDLSTRRGGPLVKLNCGAIPATLLDSELFGHEKGAFTGAVSRQMGRFERADGGTIFLDEIGELTGEAQVRLLRVLQEHEIERLGGQGPVKVDVRVVAATHRNLEEMVTRGAFRQDLYYRLAVFPVFIPPLTQRRGDLPSLLRHFITKKARSMGLSDPPEVSPEAMQRLMAYDWPGNVRELENAVERELILSPQGPLQFAWLSGGPGSPSLPPAGVEDPAFPSLDQAVKNHIIQALRRTRGRVAGPGGAAELLGLNPSTLRSKMRKLGIATRSTRIA